MLLSLTLTQEIQRHGMLRALATCMTTIEGSFFYMGDLSSRSDKDVLARDKVLGTWNTINAALTNGLQEN